MGAIAPINPRKGVIIGAGQVGMAIAYSLLDLAALINTGQSLWT